MIPKKIHYCWFGGNKKPKLFEKCYKSWKKHCSDYEIIEWNEDNFDLSDCPLYVQQAYEAKKWAFVTDYVRLKVVYDNGGIYLDTDVELKKKLDFLLNNKAFFGFEGGKYINTGLGFGAEKGADILLEIMRDYDDIPFVKEDGSFDTLSCPRRNTEIFIRHGLKQNDSMQHVDGDILILPTVYLCPISFETGKRKFSFKTVSVHWFSASWYDGKNVREKIKKQQEQYNRQIKAEKIDRIKHLPNLLLIKILGNQRYNALKNKIKK